MSSASNRASNNNLCACAISRTKYKESRRMSVLRLCETQGAMSTYWTTGLLKKHRQCRKAWITKEKHVDRLLLALVADRMRWHFQSCKYVEAMNAMKYTWPRWSQLATVILNEIDKVSLGLHLSYTTHIEPVISLLL